MLAILAIVSPIYIIIVLGFFATRSGLFARAEMVTFGKFVVNLALPALVFNAIAQRHIADIIMPGYLLAYTAGSLAALSAVYVLGRKAAHLPGQQALLHAMGVCSSNSSFIGYPILLLALAPVAGVALAMNVIVENVIMLPLLLALLDVGGQRAHPHGRRGALADTLLRLARNPIIIALVLGMAISLSGLALPAPLARAVTLIAQTSGALSLFVIGGTLVGLPLRGLSLKVAPIAAGKLLLHPLAVALAAAALPWLGLAPLGTDLYKAAVLMAAMPMMSIYPMLTQAHGFADRSAAALALATICSYFTLSALLWLMVGRAG